MVQTFWMHGIEYSGSNKLTELNWIEKFDLIVHLLYDLYRASELWFRRAQTNLWSQNYLKILNYWRHVVSLILIIILFLYLVYLERMHRPGNKVVLIHCVELPELSINKARKLSFCPFLVCYFTVLWARGQFLFKAVVVKLA